MNPRIPVDGSGFYYRKNGFRVYSMEITWLALQGSVFQVRISFDKIVSSPSVEKLWAQLSKWGKVVANVAQSNTLEWPIPSEVSLWLVLPLSLLAPSKVMLHLKKKI